MKSFTIISIEPMAQDNIKIEELRNDKEIQEIIEIARLSKASKEASHPFDDKTRPIISTKDYGQEVKIMNFNY